jgi:hypothetical protein
VWKTQKRPTKCRCKFRVSREEADYWLGEGVIQHKVVGWTTLGERPSPTYSETQFCFTNRAAKTPRVATIEEDHIERAYVEGHQWAIDRINEWGLLARQVVYDLIVPERYDPFEGRCMFLNISDDRTSVGVNVDKIPNVEE